MIHKLFGRWKVWQLLVIVTVLLVTAASLALAGPATGMHSW
jgi:hypothetical protein